METMENTARADRLAGKVAIVTGGGTRTDTAETGIGRATALLFGRAGARVVVADVSGENARRTCDDIIAEGGEASVVVADVSDGAGCEAMVAAAMERFGSLHVLFNNAAVLGRGTAVTFEEEIFDRNVAVNLKGPALATRYAIPAMEESGGGSIIYVSSIDGLVAPYSKSVPYSLTKGALHMLTKTTASNHGREGIRANCIAPGHVQGAFPSRMIGPGTRELRRKASPLGTEGTPWDVAWLAVFLASDESRWISGVTIPVDGGLLAVAPLRAYDYLTGTTV